MNKERSSKEGKLIIEEFILGIFLLLMVFFVFAQVLSRYVLHRSLSYTDWIRQQSVK